MTPFWALYITLLAFFFGACLGSFLNVCIYRIPIGQSVVAPRSHCPKCNKFIAWYDNIPFFSYLALKAKCRHCGVGISPRYFLVELLTAVLFLAVWNRYGVLSPHPQYELVPVYWLALFGLILGTFVDFEHLIIPDRVTKGGMILGLFLSAMTPAMHGQTEAWPSLKASLIGLAVGFGVLYAVAEFGKLLFGRTRVTLDKPETVAFEATEKDGPTLVLGAEKMPWPELFDRRSDRWLFTCPTVQLGERTWTDVEVTISQRGFTVAAESFEVAQLPTLSVQTTAYTYPREAMGFGDVKLMGALGAFFGWQAVLFILFVSSVVGSLVGVGLIVTKNFKWQSRIPFGPYLALAAVVWMLGGGQLWTDYWSLLALPGLPALP